MAQLDDSSLDVLFRNAHTHNAFLPEEVPDSLLREIWDLARMAPTGGNTNPMRALFVRSKAAKERLRPTLSAGNVDKTMIAPVTAILAYDLAFFKLMPKLFPQSKMGEALAKNPVAAEEQARMNGTLQAGYFILAARAAGLDCGPMGGFDKDKVNVEFFADSTWRSLVLVNLGHGDKDQIRPRNPRLDFDEACRIL